MVQLPVVSSPGDADPAPLLRRFHRAQLQLARAVAEETDLAGGLWLRNADLQPSPFANGVLEAALSPGQDPAAVLTGVLDASADCPVRRWTLNPSVSEDRTWPLGEALIDAGWTPITTDVLHLPRIRPPADLPTAPLTVLPARSALRQYRQLMDERFACPADAAATVGRLDDAHLDAWIAIRDGRPAGAASLLTDGDTGTIADVYVAEADRGRGVGTRLLRSALESAGRSGLRTVLAAGPLPPAWAAIGFVVVGRWTRYERSPDQTASALVK